MDSKLGRHVAVQVLSEESSKHQDRAGEIHPRSIMRLAPTRLLATLWVQRLERSSRWVGGTRCFFGTARGKVMHSSADFMGSVIWCVTEPIMSPLWQHYASQVRFLYTCYAHHLG
jgi:hypothetical protein